MGAKPEVGYVATWGKQVEKNDFEVLSDVIFYVRHIGVEHSELTLLTCLFAHQAKGNIPVSIAHITNYLNCTYGNINKLIVSMSRKGLIIVKKDKENSINIIDCSPILKKIRDVQEIVFLPFELKNDYIEQIEMAI